MTGVDVHAEIKGIRYKPLLTRTLNVYDFDKIGEAISTDATFILRIRKGSEVAVSWWVSAKRTRSYPYTRVYDSLDFSGKKVTIIPIVKDEGEEGDRDFLQWDTISMMSLLGVYVIIAYYSDASRSSRYDGKITEQRFDPEYLKREFKEILSYQSDALHWNLSQIDHVGEIAQRALNAYRRISRELGIGMHSWESAQKRIMQLLEGRESFMEMSRDLAKGAQRRELLTVQPKENLNGSKGTLTIKNYLGGYYYLTCDEIEIHGKKIYLIEGKHTESGSLPSLGDIKDGLLRMILFTNLDNVRVGEAEYQPVAILKLTIAGKFDAKSLSDSQKDTLKALKQESEENGFRVSINGRFV